MNNEFKCSVCGFIFELIRNDEWNHEKALEEFHKNFPDSDVNNCNLKIVCDDCWQLVKPEKPIYKNDIQ